MIDLTFKPTTTKKISIITGHYGSGKTNVAVNMAVKLRSAFPGKSIVLVDLDIVNPYFRSTDFKGQLEALDIDVIAPVYANTNLDSPVLPAEVNTIFTEKYDYAIVDVGGDDAGAIALGRYYNQLKGIPHDMYYVINKCRYQTATAADAVELLGEIELCSRLKATQLINNTNLGELTTLQIVTESLPFADEVAKLLNIPMSFCTISCDINADITGFEPVEVYVKPFYQ